MKVKLVYNSPIDDTIKEMVSGGLAAKEVFSRNKWVIEVDDVESASFGQRSYVDSYESEDGAERDVTIVHGAPNINGVPIENPFGVVTEDGRWFQTGGHFGEFFKI